jgi:hypothetical protein
MEGARSRPDELGRHDVSFIADQRKVKWTASQHLDLDVAVLEVIDRQIGLIRSVSIDLIRCILRGGPYLA